MLKKQSKVDKITKDKLFKDRPDENAEIFLDTFQKSRAKHLKKVQEKGLMIGAGESLPDEVEYNMSPVDHHHNQ
jgi:hypothetical protein